MINLYKFYTTTCQPCKIMNERIKDIDFMIEYGALIHHIDVDKDKDLALKFNVRAVPTFAITDDHDNLLRTKVGAITVKELEDFIIGQPS